MQLSHKARIASAASSLLGVAASSGAQATGSGVGSAAQWQHTITSFHYSEADERVKDTSLQIRSTRTTEDEKTLSLSVSVDSLTGASPSGKVPENGQGGMLLSTLKDTRYSASAGYSQRLLDDSFIGSVGISYSGENDYTHTGVNGSISKELNDKHTTLSLGVAVAADQIDAVSGNRTPGTSTNTAANIGAQDKDVTDVVIGVSQVLSKTAIAQLNYSNSRSRGYLNDPYKVVSEVDSAGRLRNQITEARPDARNGHSVFAALNKQVEGGVVKPSYRYFTDDWGIDSHTVELRYAMEMANEREFEPFIRYYTQSQADFYRAQISNTEPLPAQLSSDYRLSEFAATTLGFVYRWKAARGQQYRLGLDVYNQSPSTPADQLAGQQDLNPGVQAFMVRGGVTFP